MVIFTPDLSTCPINREWFPPVCSIQGQHKTDNIHVGAASFSSIPQNHSSASFWLPLKKKKKMEKKKKKQPAGVSTQKNPTHPTGAFRLDSPAVRRMCRAFAEVDPWDLLATRPEGIPPQGLAHEVGQVLPDPRESFGIEIGCSWVGSDAGFCGILLAFLLVRIRK